jgi:hypothetical protein
MSAHPPTAAECAPPTSGLPEIGIFNAQVGNSQLAMSFETPACAKASAGSSEDEYFSVSAVF